MTFIHRLGWLGAALTTSVVAAACGGDPSSDDDDEASSSSSGSSQPSSSGGQPAVSQADCQTRCAAHADSCGAPKDACEKICGSAITAEAIACIEALSCNAGESDVAACMKKGNGAGGSSSGGSSSSGGGSSPGGACVALLASGCNNFNNPSNCCADSDHSEVTCGGNNDGHGTAQCCVQTGGKCQDVSECCGYAGAADAVKDLYKCASGVCSF